MAIDKYIMFNNYIFGYKMKKKIKSRNFVKKAKNIVNNAICLFF